MKFTLWYLITGVLLVFTALTGSLVKRLPVTAAMLYLGVGLLLGPTGLGLIRYDVVANPHLLERLSEVAVTVSLFTAGLKLRLPLNDPRWRAPVFLALGSMTVTVALVTAVGVLILGLPLGAAILLGAVLAPTDPVLASDVQVEHERDTGRVRFTLTGEAGLNDGTAFPFVMLGLGLLGLHDIGGYGWKWFTVDVLWAMLGGLGIGAILGMAVGQLVLWLRREHREAVGRDDFLSLGLIALTYGVALLIHVYGFLAVFAAGLALRRTERRATGDAPPPDVAEAAALVGHTDAATHPEHAPAYMARAVLLFNEQAEHLCEVAMVLVVGGLIMASRLPMEAAWFIPLLFLVIRPISVAPALWRAGFLRRDTLLVSWLGIRGIGSLYYLAYALSHGLPAATGERLLELTLATIAASIIIHGLSSTPLMHHFGRAKEDRGRKGAQQESP